MSFFDSYDIISLIPSFFHAPIFSLLNTTTNMKNWVKIIIMVGMVVLGLLLASFLFLFVSRKESFSTLLGQYVSSFPNSYEEPVLSFYPSTGRNQVSDENSSQNWWHYPSFQVGSYEQITNNIRYPNNPDIGTCTPAEFCGALYKDNQSKSNVFVPLPPATDSPPPGTRRVNFFVSDPL